MNPVDEVRRNIIEQCVAMITMVSERISQSNKGNWVNTV